MQRLVRGAPCGVCVAIIAQESDNGEITNREIPDARKNGDRNDTKKDTRHGEKRNTPPLAPP